MRPLINRKGLTHWSIEDLLAQLGKGNVDALDEVFSRYYERLLYYGLSVTDGQRFGLVEDVVQELFIWVANNASHLENIQHFEAYLFQSVRRNVKSKIQRSKREKVRLDRYLGRSEQLFATFQTSIEDQMVAHESSELRSTHLKNGLDQLPAHQWEVLYLRYYEGKSYKQIACILSIGVQVARNFASRGIKRLQKQMVKNSLLGSAFLSLFN